MAIFLVTCGHLRAVVRAKCITCARNIAADNAGPEGPRVWRDPATSKVTLVRESDAPGLIFKGVKIEE